MLAGRILFSPQLRASVTISMTCSRAQRIRWNTASLLMRADSQSGCLRQVFGRNSTWNVKARGLFYSIQLLSSFMFFNQHYSLHLFFLWLCDLGGSVCKNLTLNPLVKALNLKSGPFLPGVQCLPWRLWGASWCISPAPLWLLPSALSSSRPSSPAAQTHTSAHTRW